MLPLISARDPALERNNSGGSGRLLSPGYGVSPKKCATNPGSPDGAPPLLPSPGHKSAAKGGHGGKNAANAGADVATLRARFSELTEGMISLSSEIGDRLEALAKKEALSRSKEGGRVFATTKNTLLRVHSLLGGGEWEPCEDGARLLDRTPGLFRRLMDSLRPGATVDTEGLTDMEVVKLREECEFFGIRFGPPPVPGQPGAPNKTRWDTSRCSDALLLSGEGRTVTRTDGSQGWKAAFATGDVTNFKVKLLGSELGFVMIGYARAGEFSVDGPNTAQPGWFLQYDQTGHGRLCRAAGELGRDYCKGLRAGDVVEARLDTAGCSVSFCVNGEDLGPAFGAVRGGGGEGPLMPCVLLGAQGAAVAVEG